MMSLDMIDKWTNRLSDNAVRQNVGAIQEALLETEVEAQEDELDEVYSEWQDHVNMTESELEEWSANPCSREASVDPEAVIKRNLRLLSKPKSDWTENDIKDAKRTISFISRMRPNKPDDLRDGPHGCPSEWAISLLNWAFKPEAFDSVPSPPEDSDLEPVEKVTMSTKDALRKADELVDGNLTARKYRELKDTLAGYSCIPSLIDKHGSWNEAKRSAGLDTNHSTQSKPVNASYFKELDSESEPSLERKKSSFMNLYNDVEAITMGAEEDIQNPNYEFEPVPTQVVYGSRERAMERAMELGLEGVHTHTVDGTTMYMAGKEHANWLAMLEADDMAKHKDDDEEDDDDEDMQEDAVDFRYSDGDKVRWNSAGGEAMGVVRDRTNDSCYDAAIDGDVKVCGEPEEPAYLIEIFDNEEGELTGTMVAHKQDTLSSASFEMSVPLCETCREDIVRQLQELEVHEPQFTDTTKREWGAPNFEDFDADGSFDDLPSSTKQTISHHFIGSKTGFPPTNYTDLFLPVVEPNGDLNLNALRAAKARSGQVTGVDSDLERRIDSMINDLANRHFPESDFTPVEEEMSEEMQEETEVHEPSFTETVDQEWNAPDLEDFTDKSWGDMSAEERNEIGDHFIVSRTGFPADTFGDLGLPVVEPDGALNLNALQNAKARLSQTDGLTEDDIERAARIINRLAEENFPDTDFSDVEMRQAETVAKEGETVEATDDNTDTYILEPNVVQQADTGK